MVSTFFFKVTIPWSFDLRYYRWVIKIGEVIILFYFMSHYIELEVVEGHHPH